MTLDKSLRSRKGSTASRSVLSRAERIEKLQAAERWQDGVTSPLGLPKVRVYKLSMKKKKKKKEEEEGATTTAATPAAAAGKGAAGGAAAKAPAAKAPAKPAGKK